MFNPYTGTPRHPSDIASDPEGLLILEPGAPLRAAPKPQPADKLMTTAEVLAEVVRCMKETGHDYPAEQVRTAALTLHDCQERCIAEGFKYWRAPDAHGVTCTKEQAENMLAAVLGVEVEIEERLQDALRRVLQTQALPTAHEIARLALHGL